MSKVFLFLANGSEEGEAITIIDILRRGGVDITTVSINSTTKVVGQYGIGIEADTTFESVDFSQADVIIFPGGLKGVENFDTHEGVNKLIHEFCKADKKIGAICAGPTLIGKRGYLKGKTATCYPGLGHLLEGATATDNKVEISGNILTGQAFGAAIDFSLQLLENLTSKEVAENVASQIQYR